MTPKFYLGSETLEFESHLSYPIEETVTLAQVQDETNAGVMVVQTLGDRDVVILKLNFDRLSITDRTALYNWVRYGPVSRGQSFYYVNQDGLTRKVMYYGNEFNVPIVSANYATGSIMLREVLV